MVLAVPLPLSVAGKIYPTVAVSGSSLLTQSSTQEVGGGGGDTHTTNLSRW